MEIDLARLCAAAGARLVVGNVTGLDRAGKALLFSDRAPLPFDVLSIGVGSVPTRRGVEILDDSQMVPVKPMQTFVLRLDARLRRAASHRGESPVRIVIVGGGAGGVELALCLPPHLRVRLGEDARFVSTIITGDPRLVPGSTDGLARRVGRVLSERRVTVITGRRVTRVDGTCLVLDDGAIVDADVILWMTGAEAPPVLGTLGLPADARGFLLTNRALQTTAGDPIFAVGDSGTIEVAPSPKAGVFAVKQGPALWANIVRTLAGAPLRRHTPQSGFLKLLNTGDGRAIGEWKGVSFEGAWCGRLKGAIDRRFIRRYQDVARP